MDFQVVLGLLVMLAVVGFTMMLQVSRYKAWFMFAKAHDLQCARDELLVEGQRRGHAVKLFTESRLLDARRRTTITVLELQLGNEAPQELELLPPHRAWSLNAELRVIGPPYPLEPLLPQQEPHVREVLDLPDVKAPLTAVLQACSVLVVHQGVLRVEWAYVHSKPEAMRAAISPAFELARALEEAAWEQRMLRRG
ncbi:hypothetical protein DRW03_11540 [Corallococcus sp. H22C18031201]|uniref:hypothetical protein n=1 Tax=Citreicoccus inhibens TaxID=2849499 RepID=UPI000E71B4C8|nr:hypothetical protein [Citreicoccus inhibens]MBU8896401.1 hypothetical protein [Citreicoccus inhibens]RJS24215.1 hypothetical protein DRW03_11540 [Corallococcus sp. H22C18031201]